MQSFLDGNGNIHVVFTPAEAAKCHYTEAQGEITYSMQLQLRIDLSRAVEKAREVDLHMAGTFTEAENNRFLWLRDMEHSVVKAIKEAKAIYAEREMGVSPSLNDFKRYIENLDEPVEV